MYVCMYNIAMQENTYDRYMRGLIGFIVVVTGRNITSSPLQAYIIVASAAGAAVGN
jgi:hypothetical protein